MNLTHIFLLTGRKRTSLSAAPVLAPHIMSFFLSHPNFVGRAVVDEYVHQDDRRVLELRRNAYVTSPSIS